MNQTQFPQLVPAIPENPPRGSLGLSARVILLLLAFVLMAEAIIYVSAVTSVRWSWLRDRIAAAHTAALVFAASPSGMIPDDLAMEILDSVGAKTISINMHNTKRLLAVSHMPEMVDESVDLLEYGPMTSVPDAFRTLFATKNRLLNVKGPAPMGGDYIEIVLEEAPLQQALRRTSTNILVASALISSLIALLAALSLHLMVLKPIRRLTGNVMQFAKNPQDVSGIIAPSGSRHEIGRAEGALASMQTALYNELQQKKHLAALGLAVAKINHDLRNMLASAQIFSDRLAQNADPGARTLGTKLVNTLDRAIHFCQTTLAYGRSVEPAPVRTWVNFASLAKDTGDALGLGSEKSHIAWHINADPALEIHVDPDQIQRILLNIARNAVQALTETPGLEAPEIRITATRREAGCDISISDNGPGIPQQLRAGLFKAFHASSRAGGSGLGLSIAAELAEAHGGRLTLEPTSLGTSFLLHLPQPAQKPQPAPALRMRSG